MRIVVRTIITATLAATIVAGFAATASAADSDDGFGWDIYPAQER